jgi:hypothetical protein
MAKAKRAKKREWMVQVTTGEQKRQMFASTYESATRAWERIMRKARTMAEMPEVLTVSMSAVGGANFTHHYAEAWNGEWIVDKMNWEWDDWLDW